MDLQVYLQYFINNNRALWWGSVFFVFLSLFIFWKESIRIYTYKNKNAIFDFWFISAISGALGGRIVYFIANWNVLNLKSIPWFWSPYEKINNTIYLFRLYPWRFLRFWDGGFVFAGMLLGYIIAVYLLILKKKGWKWNTMFVPAFNSAIILFGGLLLMIGLYTNTSHVIYTNITMLGMLMLFVVLRRFTRLVISDYRIQVLISKVVYILIVIAVNWFMIALYFITDMNVLWQEKISVVIFSVISLIMILHYLLEKNNDEISSVKLNTKGLIKIELNKPVHLD